MIAHSILRPITCVVMPLMWCPTCEGQRPAAGAPGVGWRCQCCRELHHDESGHQPVTACPTSKEASA